MISEGTHRLSRPNDENRIILFQRVDVGIDWISELLGISVSVCLSHTHVLFLSLSSQQQTAWLLGNLALNWKVQRCLAEQQYHSLPVAQNSL